MPEQCDNIYLGLAISYGHLLLIKLQGSDELFSAALVNCVFTVKLTDGSFSALQRQMVSEEGGKSLASKCQPDLLVPKLQHMSALCRVVTLSPEKLAQSSCGSTALLSGSFLSNGICANEQEAS